jgi:hypothetical protein
MAATWSEVLDLYGRALLDVEHSLERGHAATVEFGFVLPPDLGALPPELAEVAASIAEMSSRVEGHIREAMHAVAAEQARLNRARRQTPRERPTPKFVDVNG